MLASTRGAPRTPPPTASDQRALQPLVQLHGQHGGKDDFYGVAGQVGQDAPAKGADEVSPGQDHEPDRAQHVAGGTAHDHRHAERPELAAQRLRQQGRQQRGQNVADGVAAGLAEDGRRAALEVGQHRHTDGRQRNEHDLTGRAPDRAKHRARHVDGEQCQIDRHTPRHRDSDLAAHGDQRGEHGAQHHAADVFRRFCHTDNPSFL